MAGARQTTRWRSLAARFDLVRECATASRRLTALAGALVVLGGLLPAVFTIVAGVLVSAVPPAVGQGFPARGGQGDPGLRPRAVARAPVPGRVSGHDGPGRAGAAQRCWGGVGALERVDDEVAVLAALDRAAAGDLPGRLPGGLDTQLGRELEGGVDLSTGQWQKIALGRAMMRPEPLVLVLDEPTASLDSATEHALFERFAVQARLAAASSGAITVLVSHRFSTVRMADLILVVTRAGSSSRAPTPS